MTPPELKQLAQRLNQIFASNPGPLREALAAALPQVVNSLAAIAISKEHTAAARLKAIRELLGLQRRIVHEDARRRELEIKRREAECRVIENRVSLIKAKVERDAEARKKRAALRKAGRLLATVRRIDAPQN